MRHITMSKGPLHVAITHLVLTGLFVDGDDESVDLPEQLVPLGLLQQVGALLEQLRQVVLPEGRGNKVNFFIYFLFLFFIFLFFVLQSHFQHIARSSSG